MKAETDSQQHGDALKIQTELLKAESECDQLIKEVEEYNWEHDPYPLGLAFPYPEADIYFFHDRAQDAGHLKIRILCLLERLGPSANRWKQQIGTIDFYEVYIWEGLTPRAKRPKSSGIIAAREVLRTARCFVQTPPGPEDAVCTPKPALSTRDRKVHIFIGREDFEHLDNAELSNRYRKQIEGKLGPFRSEAFRASLNRIRRAYNYPKSVDIKYLAHNPLR